MKETMIYQLQGHLSELEAKVKEQNEEILRLKNLIELIQADSPSQREFDE